MRFKNLNATAKQKAIRDYVQAWDDIKDNNTEEVWDQVEELLTGYNEDYTIEGILTEE